MVKKYRTEVRLDRELKESDLSKTQYRHEQLGGDDRIGLLGPCCSPPWHTPSLLTLSPATTIMPLTFPLDSGTCDGGSEPTPQDSKSWLEASD